MPTFEKAVSRSDCAVVTTNSGQATSKSRCPYDKYFKRVLSLFKQKLCMLVVFRDTNVNKSTKRLQMTKRPSARGMC